MYIYIIYIYVQGPPGERDGDRNRPVLYTIFNSKMCVCVCVCMCVCVYVYAGSPGERDGDRNRPDLNKAWTGLLKSRDRDSAKSYSQGPISVGALSYRSGGGGSAGGERGGG